MTRPGAEMQVPATTRACTHIAVCRHDQPTGCYVGEILAKLKEKGLDENTIVIFSSDNGPHEEGGADPTFFGRDGKLRGLKRQCYEGGIRIPFIVRWPGKVKAGEVNDHQLAFYDIMPTFCDWWATSASPRST